LPFFLSHFQNRLALLVLPIRSFAFFAF
jgi:hypothetical protein